MFVISTGGKSGGYGTVAVVGWGRLKREYAARGSAYHHDVVWKGMRAVAPPPLSPSNN